MMNEPKVHDSILPQPVDALRIFFNRGGLVHVLESSATPIDAEKNALTAALGHQIDCFFI